MVNKTMSVVDRARMAIAVEWFIDFAEFAIHVLINRC